MNARLPASDEANSNPLLLLGGCIVLIALLLAFSGDGNTGSRDSTAQSDGKTTIKTLRGGGGVGALIPGGPAPNDMQGGGQFSGGPSVDTVETVRDMMDRLPKNRNDPERYNPSGVYTPKPR